MRPERAIRAASRAAWCAIVPLARAVRACQTAEGLEARGKISSLSCAERRAANLPWSQPRRCLCVTAAGIILAINRLRIVEIRSISAWDAICSALFGCWCGNRSTTRFPTCDHENRDVKKLATELVRKVDKWDDMRHRERLPASREIGKSWEAGGTAVGDEAHLQQAGIGSCARPREEEVQGGDSQRSARFFLALQWCPTPTLETRRHRAGGSALELSAYSGVHSESPKSKGANAKWARRDGAVGPSLWRRRLTGSRE